MNLTHIAGVSPLRTLTALAVLVLGPSLAHAACSSPTGNEGDQVYNGDFKVMQFCNGTDWISMASGYSGRVTGEIQAFDLSSCPDGWSEYTAARGRFLRGLCLDGTGCQDPDGVRAAGSTQLDALQNHTHVVDYGNQLAFSGSYLDRFDRTTNTGSSFSRGSIGNQGIADARVSTETRPVNVAVLYCRKD